MVTRRTGNIAGMLGIATGGALAASVWLFDGGPGAPYPGPVREWFVEHSVEVRISAILGFVAMVSLVAFAVAFREATWALVADQTWTTIVVIQGMVVFGLLAVVSAGLVWSLAEQAAAGVLETATAATMWSLARVLFRFSTWGLVVPLAATALALSRHSRLGRVAAVLAMLVGVLLFAPTWAGLYAFAVWIALVGASLLLPVRHRVADRVAVAS